MTDSCDPSAILYSKAASVVIYKEKEEMPTGRSFARVEDDGLDRPRIAAAGVNGIVVRDDREVMENLCNLDLGSADVFVLPRNYATVTSPSEFIFEHVTSTIQKLGRQVGVNVAVPGETPYRSIHEKDAAIVAPVLVFTQSFVIEGGAALAFKFLEALSGYVKSRWGTAVARNRHAVLDVVITDGRKAKRIRYEGPIDGIPEVAAVAKEALHG